jgi:tetratricopeptide (TPR) repeat protein
MVSHNLGTAYLAMRRLPEAITWLARSMAQLPTFALTHYHLGLALQETGDEDRALVAHRRAAELAPDLSSAHRRAGDLLAQKGRLGEAVLVYERAFAVAPDTTSGRLSKAKALALQDRPSDAETWLLELLEHDASSVEAHLLLADLLIDAGRFDEARVRFEQSAATFPMHASAYLGLVSSKRLTEADRPLLGQIVSALEADGLGEREQMTLHFAAGKAHDDLGDFGRAIRHFDAANRIRRRLAPKFERKEYEERIEHLMARFTRDFFARHSAMGHADETPVLVVGMPRSGTTLIERILSSHPRVGGGGELRFWREYGLLWAETEIDKLKEVADSICADYLRVLRAIAPDALRVTDKMPFNCLWVGLVHLLFPKARIIHCRRNPVDTCLSMYFTTFA